MTSSLTFFIAGAIQGSRPGIVGIDQGYRERLLQSIHSFFPEATVLCPLTILKERFADRLEQATSVYQSETANEFLDARRYGGTVAEIRAAFCEITALAVQADVLIAFLPNHEASMGTAMEMWSAYTHGRVVIAITSMTRNLSIIATSNIILPSIASFEAFMQDGGLRELLETENMRIREPQSD
jgi:hypothetical protein